MISLAITDEKPVNHNLYAFCHLTDSSYFLTSKKYFSIITFILYNIYYIYIQNGLKKRLLDYPCISF